MVRIKDIQKSIDTDFSSILNQYNAFLECSKDSKFVIDNAAVRGKVEEIIQEISSREVGRIPYDSITIKVIDFNENSEEYEGLSESFDNLLTETEVALKNIIDDFLIKNTFKNLKVQGSESKKLKKAIIAFYKLLEHTKLADSQYQSLYQKTEIELGSLEENLLKSNDNLTKLKADFTKVKQDITVELDKIKETKSSIYTDFIAILGVFSAIVFVMFGGIEITRAIFDIGEDLTNLHLSKIITIASLVLAGVLILLYSFFLWLARLTGKDFGNCHKCENKCTKKFWHLLYRHTFFFGAIILLILVAFLCYKNNF